MTLKSFMKRWIAVMVKGGFVRMPTLVRDIRERVADELGKRDPKLETELVAYAKKLDRAVRAAEAKWKTRTTNDAIDDAFAALDAAGIVTLQAAGFTMSDGWEDVNEKARARKKKPRGATFYHEQDLERGVAGEGLMLAYGAYETNKKKRDAASIAVGREIVETLARFGVKAKWSGDVSKRIEIPPFPWKKRRFTKAPKK